MSAPPPPVIVPVTLPFGPKENVSLDVRAVAKDLFDSVENRVLVRKAAGTVSISIPANGARVVTIKTAEAP